MNNNHTDITVVLDRSGSMASVRQDTIGGFNTFLKEQKEAKGTASITLYQFDDQFETVLKNADIKSAKKLTDKTFVPRGMTALLDAVGRAINETGERLAKTPEKERAGKVVFVIITDGEENASREFVAEKIKEMITHQSEKYNWQFVFLGADQDSFTVAKTYGISYNSTMNFAKTACGVENMYKSMSSNIAAYRSSMKSSVDFEDEDRKIQDQEINK